MRLVWPCAKVSRTQGADPTCGRSIYEFGGNKSVFGNCRKTTIFAPDSVLRESMADLTMGSGLRVDFTESRRRGGTEVLLWGPLGVVNRRGAEVRRFFLLVPQLGDGCGAFLEGV